MEDLKEKLKVQLIEQLNLEDITPADINSSDPLFGEGLGLDSIDALEIIVLLQKEYGIKIEDTKKGKEIFQSIDTLAAYIEANGKSK
jgi:acyl carrier protein